MRLWGARRLQEHRERRNPEAPDRVAVGSRVAGGSPELGKQ